MYIITGGGSGIGKALALALARREQPVLIIGRREKPLLDTALQSSFIQILTSDISTEQGRDQLFRYLQKYDTVSALINNAGTIEPIAPVQEITPLAWHQSMATNVDAPLFLTQALYSRLKHARVLNIGSAAAYFPVEGWAAYCVSKAALSMLTRSWQLESKDVAFASVMPGIIDTDMQAYIRQASSMSAEKQEFFKGLKAQDKLVSPETVAEFLCWLLMDVSRDTYQSQEWDIYNKAHHSLWLRAPHDVPVWE